MKIAAIAICGLSLVALVLFVGAISVIGACVLGGIGFVGLVAWIVVA